MHSERADVGAKLGHFAYFSRKITDVEFAARVNLSTDKCCLKSTLNYAMLDIPAHTRYKPGYAS